MKKVFMVIERTPNNNPCIGDRITVGPFAGTVIFNASNIIIHVDNELLEFLATDYGSFEKLFEDWKNLLVVI